jgi:hypothetical protein
MKEKDDKIEFGWANEKRQEKFHDVLETRYILHYSETRGTENNGMCYLISLLTEMIDRFDDIDE